MPYFLNPWLVKRHLTWFLSVTSHTTTRQASALSSISIHFPHISPGFLGVYRPYHHGMPRAIWQPVDLGLPYDKPISSRHPWLENPPFMITPPFSSGSFQPHVMTPDLTITITIRLTSLPQCHDERTPPSYAQCLRLPSESPWGEAAKVSLVLGMWINDDKLMINDDKLMINDDKLMINDDKLMINHDKLMINDDKLMINDDKLMINHDKLMINHDKLMINHDKLMINDDKLMINDDKLMINDDKLMINDDKLINSW